VTEYDVKSDAGFPFASGDETLRLLIGGNTDGGRTVVVNPALSAAFKNGAGSGIGLGLKRDPLLRSGRRSLSTDTAETEEVDDGRAIKTGSVVLSCRTDVSFEPELKGRKFASTDFELRCKRADLG